MDYSAGNSRGPHHRPTMHDEDNSNGWPPLPSKPVVWAGEPVRKNPGIHQCFYCQQKGHWNSQCLEPHRKCPTQDRCVVPYHHPAFNKECSLGGRTVNNQVRAPSKLKKRKRPLSPSFYQDTPASTPTTSPPADSLLFSPNPLPFRESPDQETPSWGSAPWGSEWEESLQFARKVSLTPPPIENPHSPCIFDYGREGSEPFYLGNTGSELVRLSPDHLTLPRNYGVEDLTTYTEDNLPGAVYNYNDDPFAPTMAMVDQYRRMSVRNLGVSD